MGERKVLGLVYGYNEGWIAGSYYIENLIGCLLLLPDCLQPEIKVYVFKEESRQALRSKGFIKSIKIIMVRDCQSFMDRIINKVCYRLMGKYLIVRGFDQEVDAIFPNPNTFHFHKMENRIAWIPDFQEHFFPEFFSKEEVKMRDKSHREIAEDKNKVLVLSSESALNDYQSFYPEQQSQNFVIPFAVTIPSLDGIERQAVLDRYQLRGDYFICSNQFWAHKGHNTLLRAIRDIKSKGKRIKVVFTGSTHDSRNPEYYGELLSTIEDFEISTEVVFLGFIPREDQLVLMAESLAILQPSQFEGWSTVVEDAKVLNKSIIVSDLEVHKEQLAKGYNGFFETNNVDSLSRKMQEAFEGSVLAPGFNYLELQKEFGRKVMDILYNVS